MFQATFKINYHPQSGWFEDTPLKGGTEEGCPLKGVHEGTCLIEARQPAWNHSRASGLTVVLRLGLLCGVGSGTPPQDVLSSHSTPERQSLFESHRQRRWLTRWSYIEYACWRCSCSSLKWIEPRHRLQVTSCHPRTTRERRRLRVRRWPQAVCSRSVSHRWIGCSIVDLHRCCQGRTGAVIAQTAR